MVPMLALWFRLQCLRLDFTNIYDPQRMNLPNNDDAVRLCCTLLSEDD